LIIDDGKTFSNMGKNVAVASSKNCQAAPLRTLQCFSTLEMFANYADSKRENEMTDSSTIEERLMRIEKDVADLKTRMTSLGAPKQNWIDAISGSFKGDSDFAEIIRLGKEIRAADRPEPESM
jgi:hypothetical protein